MTREELINNLKKYNFDNNKYLVISGGATVLLGIKDHTSDIDIAVTPDYYNYLINNYNCIFDRINEFNNKCYIIDNIINFGIDYYSEKKNIIDDIPVQTKEDLIKLKEFLNREKDKADIKKIKEFYNE